MTCGEPLATGVDDVDQVAVLRRAVDAAHGAGEEPRVAALKGFLLTRRQDQFRFHLHRLGFLMVALRAQNYKKITRKIV